ncbi:unnamed protein product [Calypogeia fissa]
MDAVLLPLQSTCPTIVSHNVCRRSCLSTPARSGTKLSLLSSSYSRLQTNNLRASLKVSDMAQLRSTRTGLRSFSSEAKLATDEEGGVNGAKLAEKNEEIQEIQEEQEEEEAESAVLKGSASDKEAIKQSVEVLKTAAKTRKVPASEIVTAFKVLAKAKLDPTNFLPIVGGTKSPGRKWLLIFTCNKEEYNSIEGKGTYLPISAVQNFDAEAMSIQNGVYLGPLGELIFCGNFMWEKRNLRFFFHTLKIKLGPFGPFSIPVGSKDQEIKKNNPGFIWSYVDDEILVGMGKAGGTAFWVRCERVEKPLY